MNVQNTDPIINNTPMNNPFINNQMTQKGDEYANIVQIISSHSKKKNG